MKEEDFMFIDLIENGAIEYAGLNEKGEKIGTAFEGLPKLAQP